VRIDSARASEIGAASGTRISHRNVVRSHDLANGRLYFLSMEYIQGTTVADLLPATVVSPSTRRSRSHAAGRRARGCPCGQIIHPTSSRESAGDETGALKVTDFGWRDRRSAAASSRKPPGRRDAAVHVAGTLMGGDVDARTDCSRPARSSTSVSRSGAVRCSTPGLVGRCSRAARPCASPAPCHRPRRIIERLLLFDADKRYNSARELADALTKVS